MATKNCWLGVGRGLFLLSLARKERVACVFLNLEKILNGLRVLVPQVQCPATGGHGGSAGKCHSRGFQVAVLKTALQTKLKAIQVVSY